MFSIGDTSILLLELCPDCLLSVFLYVAVLGSKIHEALDTYIREEGRYELIILFRPAIGAIPTPSRP